MQLHLGGACRREEKETHTPAFLLPRFLHYQTETWQNIWVAKEEEESFRPGKGRVKSGEGRKEKGRKKGFLPFSPLFSEVLTQSERERTGSRTNPFYEALYSPPPLLRLRYIERLIAERGSPRVKGEKTMLARFAL